MKTFIPLTPSNESHNRFTARLNENRPFKKGIKVNDILMMHKLLTDNKELTLQEMIKLSGLSTKKSRLTLNYLLKFKLAVTKH